MLALMVGCMISNVDVVYASDSEKIQIQDYEISQGEMKVFVNNITREINQDNIMIKMNNQQLNVNNMQAVDLGVVPTTYYCLVDVSGSLDKDRIAEVRNILDSLVQQMKDADNICITKFADEFESTGFTSDKVLVSDFISKIEVTNQDTNLYVHVKDSLEALKNEQGVHTNKCLIILSDGAEDQKTGITMDEALTMVKESDIPVYTVAMLKQKSTEKQLESAKILGSFARSSAGGIHYAPVIENIAYGDISALIRENMGSTYIVTCELKDIELAGNNAEVQVSYTDANGQQYFNDKNIPTEKLKDFVFYTPVIEEEPEVPEEPIVEVVPVVEEVVVEEEEPAKYLGMEPWLFFTILGVLVVIIIVSLILIIMGNKKKKAKLDAIPINPIPMNPLPVNEPVQNKVYEYTRPLNDAPKSEPKNGLKVTLIPMKGTREDLVIYVSDSCKIGRDKKKCDYTIENDKSLSGLHCTLKYNGKNLYVKDEGSSNGSFVNGVSIDGEYRLEKDDVLFIGSSEYRVNW